MAPRTDWMVDLAVVLARIDSMNPGGAGADAAELRRIIAAAQRIGADLRREFADTPELSGFGAQAAGQAGRSLGVRIAEIADSLDPAQQALTDAVPVLAASAAMRPRLLMLGRLGADSRMAGAVRQNLAAAMTTVYSEPMGGRADVLQVPAVAAQAPGRRTTAVLPGGAGVGHGSSAVGGGAVPGGVTAAAAQAPTANAPGAAAERGRPDAAPSPGHGDGGAGRGGAGQGGAGAPPGGSAPGGASPVPAQLAVPGERRPPDAGAADPSLEPAAAGPAPVPMSVPVAGPGPAGLRSGGGVVPRPVSALLGAGLGAAAAGAAGPALATGAGAGSASRAGSSPPIGPASGRGAGEDTRRRRPGYLLSVSEAVGLIGPLPLAGPPVLGETETAPAGGDRDPAVGVEPVGTERVDDDRQEHDFTL